MTDAWTAARCSARYLTDDTQAIGDRSTVMAVESPLTPSLRSLPRRDGGAPEPARTRPVAGDRRRRGEPCRARPEEMRAPAIVISGHFAGLAVTRSLGRAGVPVVALRHNAADFGHCSRWVTKDIAVPHPEHEQPAFIERLLELVPDYAGALVIPTSDEAVKAVSRHKQRLQEHYVVACVDWTIAERFIDKKHTYARAAELGVPAPRTVVAHSIDDLESARDVLEFPCLVKPRESHRYEEAFGRKMVTSHTFDDMRRAYLEAAGAGLDVLIQEFIPGDDTAGVNYNAYMHDGEPVVACTAQKIRLKPAQTGRPRVLVSRDIPDIAPAACTILNGLGVYGFACTEFKRDARDGVYKLMEINGRPNLSTGLSVRCGVNFPTIIYEHLMEGRLPAPRPWRTGLYWVDGLSDAVHTARHLRDERVSPQNLLRPYLRPHVWASFELRDVRPFAARTRALARSRSPGSGTPAGDGTPAGESSPGGQDA